MLLLGIAIGLVIGLLLGMLVSCRAYEKGKNDTQNKDNIY